MLLRGNLSSVVPVLFWDDVAIDVSVEVFGNAWIDGVCQKVIGPLWSGLWLYGCEDLGAVPFLKDR